MNVISRIKKPAGSCHIKMAFIPWVEAITARIALRTRFPSMAPSKATTRRSKRRYKQIRKYSPKKSATINPPCSERIPLHASSTPSIPVCSMIRLPCRSASNPSQCSDSMVMSIFNETRTDITDCSIFRGQGTATRKKAQGKLRCQSHLHPPILSINARDMPKAEREAITPKTLQSGFASAIGMVAASINAVTIARVSANKRNRQDGISNGGISRRRLQKSPIASKGTTKP